MKRMQSSSLDQKAVNKNGVDLSELQFILPAVVFCEEQAVSP